MHGFRARSSHLRPQPGPVVQMGRQAPPNRHVIVPPPPRSEVVVRVPVAVVPDVLPRLKRPRDGIIRAVASEAAKTRPRLPSPIGHFAKSVHSYCVSVLGYGGKYVVEEFVYLAIQRKVEERCRKSDGQVAGLYERLLRKPTQLKKQLAQVLAPITHADVEQFALEVFQDIEASILVMATLGRKLKRRSTHGYLVRKDTIPWHGTTCYILIDERDGESTVVRVMTSHEYQRSARNRPRNEHGRYTNRPRSLLH